MAATPVRRSPWVRMDRISLAVVLIATAVLIVLIPRSNAEPRPVDYSSELAAARVSAPYEVAVPVDLADGWRPTSVRFFTHDGATRWHLGFVTPSGRQVGLDQVDISRPSFVDLVTGGGGANGYVTIDGLSWGKRLVTDRGLRSLVLQRPESVTVISGKTDHGELIELADSLAWRR